MKTLKRILIILVVLIVAVVVVSQFLPSSYHVQRSVIIAARPDGIFPWINQLRKWQEWSAWTPAKDPTLALTYEGPEEGVGAICKWSSKKFGDGMMKIVEADPTKGLKLNVSFMKGRYTYVATFRFGPSGSDTKVTWSTDGEVGSNPLDRYCYFLVMDSMMGKDTQEGLANLKKRAEGK